MNFEILSSNLATLIVATRCRQYCDDDDDDDDDGDNNNNKITIMSLSHFPKLHILGECTPLNGTVCS